MSQQARARVLYAGPDEHGRYKYWYAETLWKAAEQAEVQEVEVASLEILDEVVWFGGHQNIEPTIRRVAERARDIFQADLGYPIIQIRGGEIIDGAHRIARAYLEGRSTIRVAVLDDYPPHDGTVAENETAPPPISPTAYPENPKE